VRYDRRRERSLACRRLRQTGRRAVHDASIQLALGLQSLERSSARRSFTISRQSSDSGSAASADASDWASSSAASAAPNASAPTSTCAEKACRCCWSTRSRRERWRWRTAPTSWLRARWRSKATRAPWHATPRLPRRTSER